VENSPSEKGINQSFSQAQSCDDLSLNKGQMNELIENVVTEAFSERRARKAMIIRLRDSGIRSNRQSASTDRVGMVVVRAKGKRLVVL
jgi:hypothetical protein